MAPVCFGLSNMLFCSLQTINNFFFFFRNIFHWSCRSQFFPFPGYKMCLRVNLHGVDSGASTHISMFVHLMQGDFDTILPWPFSGKITLTAVDQSENEPLHVTETLVARPGLQAFLRPRASRNHKGYGYVEMISHSVLKTREYLKNNSLIIHVSVSSEQ